MTSALEDRIRALRSEIDSIIEWAKALVDAKPVELWDGSIRIARFEPWHGRHANRSAAAGVKRT
jgi:hypothetical protein